MLNRIRAFALACLTAVSLMIAVPARATGPLPYFFQAPPAAVTPNLSPITHIIVIDQENRSFNNIFMSYPGATTATTYTDAQGNTYNLSPVPLTNQAGPSPTASPDSYDLNHQHANFQTECGNGGGLSACPMNNFGNEQCINHAVTCAAGCPTPAANNPDPVPTPAGQTLCAMAYVPNSGAGGVGPYWTIAENYSLGDEVAQDNQGPSFPAHLYLWAGSSAESPGSSVYLGDNNSGGEGGSGHMGCDSPVGTVVNTFDITTGAQGSGFTCSSITPIASLLDTAGVPWKYYVYTPNSPYHDNLWTAPDQFTYIGCTYGASAPTCPTEFTNNVINPPSQVLTDISSGRLASVSWVIPTAKASDHAGITDGSGPAWVESIVNAIGNSQYWNNTAIIITWDDWGGWYDPVVPTMHNYYEYGFRVPFMVVSAYTPQGLVSHTPELAFGGTLHFIESTFNLPSLGNDDARAGNLSEYFNFNNPARSFSSLSYHGQFTKQWFMATMPRDKTPIDDDGPGSPDAIAATRK